MDGGDRVGDAQLEVRPLLLHLVRRRLHVAQVVQRVEDAHDVDAPNGINNSSSVLAC